MWVLCKQCALLSKGFGRLQIVVSESANKSSVATEDQLSTCPRGGRMKTCVSEKI